MKDQMYSLGENRTQHGGHGFHSRLTIFQASSYNHRDVSGKWLSDSRAVAKRGTLHTVNQSLPYMLAQLNVLIM